MCLRLGEPGRDGAPGMPGPPGQPGLPFNEDAPENRVSISSCTTRFFVLFLYIIKLFFARLLSRDPDLNSINRY